MDANTPITLAVAVHAVALRARDDFVALCASCPTEGTGHIAVAELARDVAGSFRVIRHETTMASVAAGRALLGGVLALLVPPAGAGFLASVRSVGGAGAVAGLLHRTIPQEERDLASKLLERHAAAVVVVAVDRRPSDVTPLLRWADETLAMVSVWDGLDRAIELEIAEAHANPSGT